MHTKRERHTHSQGDTHNIQRHRHTERVDGGKVQIDMTLTTPNCPVADLMPSQVFDEVSKVEDVVSVRVELVWEPSWTVADLTARGKAALELLDIDINHMIAKINENTTGITFSGTKSKRRNDSK